MTVSHTNSPPPPTRTRRWSLPGAAIVAGVVLATTLLTGGVSSASLPVTVVDDFGIVCRTTPSSALLWAEFDRLASPIVLTAPSRPGPVLYGPARLVEAPKAADLKGVDAVSWTVDDKLTRALKATEWGLTQPQRTTLDIVAFCKGGAWRNVISTADGLVHTKARMRTGVTEVTAALVAGEKDCGTLSRMATSLQDVADDKEHQGYYMLAAVTAHENLHVTQFRTAVDAAFATFKTAVEGLTIPKADAKDAAEAAAKIKALPAYTAALTAFRAAETKAAADTASHKPAGAFPKAEHAVVDPMITKINARRAELKCP